MSIPAGPCGANFILSVSSSGSPDMLREQKVNRSVSKLLRHVLQLRAHLEVAILTPDW